MLGAMDAHPTPAVTRRGPLAAEIAVLAAALAVDTVAVALDPGGGGLLPAMVGGLTPVLFPAAVLTVLRRRFPALVPVFGLAVAAIVLVESALRFAAHRTHATVDGAPGLTGILALALLVGAGCRRLRPWHAAGLAVAAGAAMTAAPVLGYGVHQPKALLAVPAALLWGGALAVGLILRDGDARRRAALAEVRTAERLNLARELHDLVAHHVTGIVVRAQAAQVAPARDGGEAYREIEEAGSEALTAMRRLVGMLRTGAGDAPPPAQDLRGAVLDAAAGHDVALSLADDLDGLVIAPELVTTAHRVVLEALTNVRRHAPDAREVGVSVRLRREGVTASLVVEVTNDGAAARGGAGYGLTGMAERVEALGGKLHAGAEPHRRWRVSALIPLDGFREAPR